MISGKKTREKPSIKGKSRRRFKSKEPIPTAHPADVASVDSILRALYEGISFFQGAEPDWNRLRSLFYPGATLTHAKADKTDVLDVDGFIAGGKKVIKSGKLASFYESEVSSKIDTFGRIAQVFSTYESRFRPADPEPFARGINSIQVLKEDGRWWVLSIFWADEVSEGPIPEQYSATRPA